MDRIDSYSPMGFKLVCLLLNGEVYMSPKELMVALKLVVKKANSEFILLFLLAFELGLT